MPKNIDKDKVLSSVSPAKDVDGFHECNLGSLLIGNENIAPCTPLGIVMMLDRMGVDLSGKDAVVIGRSVIVGKPMMVMLLNRNATVSACHTRTKDIGMYTRQADVIVTAAGVPGLIKKDMVKPGAVVIDAGIKKVEGKVLGDVDFDEVKEVASYITPVPGGVGPMTVAVVLHNTLMLAEKQEEGRS